MYDNFGIMTGTEAARLTCHISKTNIEWSHMGSFPPIGGMVHYKVSNYLLYVSYSTLYLSANFNTHIYFSDEIISYFNI